MNLEDVIKNINDAKEQLQKSVDIKKSEEDAEQQEEANKSVEPKTKEDAEGHKPVEKSENEVGEAPEDDAEKSCDQDDDAEKSCGTDKKVAKSEDEPKDDESEEEDDESEDDDDESDDDAKKSCGSDKEVAKSDDAEDDESEDEVEDCDQRAKNPNVAKSVFMQHLEAFENLSKSYIDLANASIELAQSVLAKSVDAKGGQEVVEKSVEPEPEVPSDPEPEAEPEAEPEKPAVEKSVEPEPEADNVEKSLPQGKALQYANDKPEDDGIEKSVEDEPVKVSELKDAVTKSIRGLQGYTLMTKEQGALKSLLHKVDELNPEDVAPEELIKAYNEI